MSWSSIFTQSRDYIDFQVVVNDNPYPANMFIHSMSMDNRYMAVIDSTLNTAWYINSGPLGMDFKVNQDRLSYFHKPNQFWIILNEFMTKHKLNKVFYLDSDVMLYYNITIEEQKFNKNYDAIFSIPKNL